MTWRSLSPVLLLAVCWAQAATACVSQREIKITHNGLQVGTQFQGSGQRYLISTKQLDWMDAKELCQEINMTLVSFDTLQKQTRIVPFFQRDFKYNHFWTSGNDIRQEGNFVWESLNLPFQYKNWLSGRPRSDVTKNCVDVTFASGKETNRYCALGPEYRQHCPNNTVANAKWTEESCQMQQLFICE